MFYNTVISDLSDLRDVYYDILVFLVLQGLSLCFTISQTFSKTIHVLLCLEIVQSKPLRNANLRIDILAPTPTNPSMTKALDEYIAKANKR
ncbi:MAG: hypothetical protein CM15mP83_4940 [Flavobacteriaceae bacterium]|nr:MAG: hypothetical protein CM15mP83_4940 [Flavobacteriaceae bacterium]